MEIAGRLLADKAADDKVAVAVVEVRWFLSSATRDSPEPLGRRKEVD